MKSGRQNISSSMIVDDLDIAAALDELGLEMSTLDNELRREERTGAGLDSLWQVPPDFEDRIARGVRRRLRNRQTAWLVADLMGLAFDTAKAIIKPDQGGPRD